MAESNRKPTQAATPKESESDYSDALTRIWHALDAARKLRADIMKLTNSPCVPDALTRLDAAKTMTANIESDFKMIRQENARLRVAHAKAIEGKLI